MSNLRTSSALPTSTVIAAIAGATLAMSLATYWVYHRHNEKPFAIEGRPLLASDPVFIDDQLGWSFRPPTDWAMQARSLDTPTNPHPERMIVKYKQFILGQPDAWLRISVAENIKGLTSAALLKERKLPESSWKRNKVVEDNLPVGNQTGSRITFTGPFDTEGRGQRDYTCETVAVVAKNRVFYFAGFFPTGDAKSQQRIHDALATVTFSK